MGVILLFVVSSLLVSGIAVFFLKYWHPVSNPKISTDQWADMLRNTSMLHAISGGADPHRAFRPLFEVGEGPINIVASAVSESKFVSKLHYNQAESTLAVLGFLNAAVSTLTFGVGLGGQYSYGHHRQYEEAWITCQYLIPKFNLLLNPTRNTWMKINEQFKNEARDLAIKGKSATHEEIGEFLAVWGEYFPTELVVGGELYSETHKKCDAQATEHGFKIETEVAFKADLSKCGLGLGGSADFGNTTTDISESLVISCKGGVTERLGRPGEWLESLADPTTWVPIQLDKVVKVLDLLPNDMNQHKINLEALIKEYKAKELELLGHKPILNNSPVKLKLDGTNRYIATPHYRKDYPHAHVDTLPCPHIIQLDDAMGSPIKHIINGATVRLITPVTTHEGYIHLYSADQGTCYYDQLNKNCTKQRWQVRIVGKGVDELLYDGDKVQFVNMGWPDRKLYMYDDDAYVGAGKKDQDNVWQVCL